MDFTFLIIILLAVAFLLRVDFIFYIVYVCVGLYAWSRWYPPRALRQLTVWRDYADHAFWGEVVPVKVQVKNNSRLPLPWVNMSESLAVELAMGIKVNHVVSLRGRQTVRFTYEVKARQRGYYQLGPLHLANGDLFGFTAEFNGRFPPNYLTIYPRLTPLTELGLPSRLPFGTLPGRQRLFEDPARPNGVRDFRSGDTQRQINWKVSAHMRQLMVKTYQPAISLETAVLLNLHSGDYRRKARINETEWAIEVAASLASHLINRRQAVGLIVNGIDPLHGEEEAAVFDEESGRLVLAETAASFPPLSTLPPPIPPRPGRPHLMKILERLARIETADTIPCELWIPTAGHDLSWGTTILAVTARGDEKVCQSLYQLVRAGFNPILITIEPDYNFDQVKERARRLGFVAYNVPRRSGLAAWQRPSRQRIAR